MRRLGSTDQWCRFLEAVDAEEAAADLRRRINRLEDVYEGLRQEILLLASSPGGEVDEILKVALSTISEGIELLDSVRVQLQHEPPDEAA